ncbi:MAG: universal stress protein [SAR202 cluster bacterium]|nr:universal stress protein [SAR202 cluster bacterium]
MTSATRATVPASQAEVTTVNTRTRYARILVPLDGSEVSESILPWVTELAKGIGAELALMNVADEPGGTLRSPVESRRVAEYSSGSGAHEEDFRNEFEPVLVGRPVQRSADWLKEVAARLASNGLRVTTTVETGDPAEGIIRIAHLKGCDLIALGTRGRSAIGRGILGSTTDRVVHASDVPMLIVRSGASINSLERALVRFPSTIIAGLDGSTLAEGILGTVATLSRQLKVDVRLVRAYPTPRRRLRGAVPSTGVEKTRHALERETRDYLEVQAAKLRDEGLSVSTDVASGAAESVLLKTADRWPGSLLVVGTRGLSGLSRWVVGSVTDRTIRAASGPVLVIPPRLGGAPA